MSKVTLATSDDVNALRVDLGATLATSRDALLSRLDRGLRRTVLTLGTLIVAMGAAVVLLAKSFT